MEVAKVDYKNFLHNQGLKLIVWAIWAFTNIYLFISTFLECEQSAKYRYMFLVCGYSFCVARASASALNFNCALILIPMCRCIMTWVRVKIFKHLHSNQRRLLNHLKGLHILCAHSTCFFGLIHTISHLVNYFRMKSNSSKLLPHLMPVFSVSDMPIWSFLRKTIPGSTGVAMTLVLVLVILTSIHAVRRKKYEVFWYSHHLSLCFLILMAVHGFGDFTKIQTNINSHGVHCANITHPVQNLTSCPEQPSFKHKDASTWKWLIGPFLLYAFDRLLRLYRGLKVCAITKVTLHEGNVIEIQMYKKDFKAKPGSYVLIQCPDIANFQWHAFTLTKCPKNGENQDPTFSVHIKISGDWTMRLFDHLSKSLDICGHQLKIFGDTCVLDIDKFHSNVKERAENNEQLPVIYVDGPYGSPNEDVFRYPVNISIAAGIGITPFAAILNDLRKLTLNKLHKNFKMKRMYLIWTCRDVKDFTWFLDLIIDTMKHLVEEDLSDLLVFQLHVTRKTAATISDVSKVDETVELFKKKLKFGRPDFNELFGEIALFHHKQRIGVFYCGPKPIAPILYESCTSTKVQGNTFIFHKESFA